MTMTHRENCRGEVPDGSYRASRRACQGDGCDRTWAWYATRSDKHFCCDSCRLRVWRAAQRLAPEPAVSAS